MWGIRGVGKVDFGICDCRFVYRQTVYALLPQRYLAEVFGMVFALKSSLRSCEAFDVLLLISTRTKFLYVPDLYAMHRECDDTAGAMAGKNLVVNAPRVAERFYFQLGGNSYVPKRPWVSKISRKYLQSCFEPLQGRVQSSGNYPAEKGLVL